jgi:hypothetical protein
MGEHSNGVGMSEKVTVPSSLNLHVDYIITNTVAEAVADTQQEKHSNVVGMAEQHLKTDNVTEIQLVESDHEDKMHRQHLSHSQSNPASLIRLAACSFFVCYPSFTYHGYQITKRHP